MVPFFVGAGGRIRTPDLLITNQLLYRLSYTSIFECSITISYLVNSVKGKFDKHTKS